MSINETYGKVWGSTCLSDIYSKLSGGGGEGGWGGVEKNVFFLRFSNGILG